MNRPARGEAQEPGGVSRRPRARPASPADESAAASARTRAAEGAKTDVLTSVLQDIAANG
ncbi:hypothetical protein [Streptomyces sp. NPDC085529]|uniref:hypothetical protein n=1 Tax=Streptomyces sp. NPDC085529 TaxID=3365729 RepID=UPI0037D2D0E3